MATFFYNAVFQQVTQTLINPYSGYELEIDDIYGIDPNQFHGTAGSDTLIMTVEDEFLNIEDSNGNQTFSSIETIFGTNGDDILNFSSATYTLGATTVFAGNGDDVVWGNVGDDDLQGNDGNDILDGGPGHDSIIGGNQNDILFGGDGDDTINGQADNDIIYGDAGEDNLFGSSGDDELTGGADNDELNGGDGYDIAHYALDFADYAITVIASGLRVEALVGNEGTDTVLDNVEKLIFANGEYENGEFTTYNVIPVLGEDSASVDENSFVTINVLANDFDANGDILTVINVFGMDHGSAVINADNTITYTPDEDYFGGDSFYYQASDGNGGVATQLVNVTVNDVADPNQVNVGFSNNGIAAHYVVESTNIAGTLNIMSSAILGSTFISDNVSGGLFDQDPYSIPSTMFAAGGDVSPDYTNVSSFDEAYQFVATGWNNVKNITAEASGDQSIMLVADNFVHADMDFSGVTNDVDLRIYDAKRGNYLTGDGDDRIEVTTATNNSGWSNLHKMNTGTGDDVVIIDRGDASLINSTIVNFVDGRYTTVEADLGGGDDIFLSTINNKTIDLVHGREGSDTIDTGAGNDVIWGGEDNGVLFQIDDQLYALLAEGDRLYGGSGSDEFVYDTGGSSSASLLDGFDHIVDFEDNDVLTILSLPTDNITTDIVTLQTDGGDLTGTMVSINDLAAVFLEDYTNTTEIFV